MILVLVEHDRGVIEPTSLQALTFACDLTASTNSPTAAAVIGEGAEGLPGEIHRHGIPKVYHLQHDRLDDYAPAAWAESLIQLYRSLDARIVLAAATERGNETLAHVAARTGQPMAANCSEVRPGDEFEITRLRWGGSLLEDAVLECDPKLLTLAPHVVEARTVPSPSGELEVFHPSLEEIDFKIRVTRREERSADQVTLKTASVVVGGGRGVGSAEGFRTLEELAEVVDGVVGGSRVATNNGWRPHSHQVGLTGNRIAPNLYIACGISGAIQHLVGCKSARNILVINSDREAPFFKKADYGVVGDLHQIVPALTEAIRSGKV